jgi:predicted phage replisome organizer
MGSDVFWIKLHTRIFDSESIILLESMPEGDTLLIIWFKMQILAGKCNVRGYLLLNGERPYSDEMLATVFRRPLNTVRLAISAFLQFKMVEVIDGAYFLAEWEIHQNVSGMDKIREQTKVRVARHRSNKKNVAVPVTLQVTLSNAIETETETEIEKQQQEIRLLLSGTPLSKISEKELKILIKRHVSERVIQAADFAAEKWRRERKEIKNPGGYLQTFCEDLVVPEWYEPPEVRNAKSEEVAERKRTETWQMEEQLADEEREAQERDDYWYSLSEEERQKHRDDFRATAPFMQDLEDDFLDGLAKLTAWDKRQQMNTITSSTA